VVSLTLRQNTSLSMGTASASSRKNRRCGVFGLVGLHYRSSHRKPFAVPIGQGKLRQHYIARRKSVCIFEESSYSAYAILGLNFKRLIEIHAKVTAHYIYLTS